MQSFLERLRDRHGKSFAVSFGLGLLFALLVLTPMAGAQQNDAVEQTQEMRTQAEQRSEERAGRQAERQNNRESREEMRENRLSAKKLEICEKRQDKIQNIMARIADRGEKQLEVFTKISERTQTFYVDKGLSVANYDELVADVNQKKLAAELQVETIRDTSVSFECDGDDPRGVAGSFKESLKLQISALKEYRTSVKNLIVGIRVAAEDQEGEEADTSDTTEDTTDETSTEEGEN